MDESIPMSHQNNGEGLNYDQDANLDEVEFASLTIEEMESKLEVGKHVENELVTYGIYCIYARAKGFAVRKGNNEWFSDGSGLRAKDFLCNCEGNKDEKRSKNSVPVYVKPTVRCNCKAKLRVARTKGQSWRITGFYKEHNHDMYAADQTYLLKTSRHVSNETQRCIESMVKCGIRVSSAYNFLQNESNGRENVGCTQTPAAKKGTKRKGLSKQTMPIPELPVQTPARSTKQKGQSTQTMAIPKFPSQIQTPITMQQHFLQQQFNPYTYPYQQPFLASQANGTQFSQSTSRPFEVSSFPVPLMANQFPRSYASPFVINPVRTQQSHPFIGQTGKANADSISDIHTNATPANSNVDAG